MCNSGSQYSRGTEIVVQQETHRLLLLLALRYLGALVQAT